jgi:hypothetical protein
MSEQKEIFEGRKYTLEEAQKVLDLRAKQRKQQEETLRIRDENANLRALNKIVKRAHKAKVREVHRQNGYIAKLERIVDVLAERHPEDIKLAMGLVKAEREGKVRDRLATFREARRRRHAARKARQSAQLASEASERMKAVEKERLAKEAQKAEEQRNLTPAAN